ncbi:MAG: hypothetical protein WC998_02035 [Candidatus Paceibacterota bacterium]|jgi:hypothetical protein
MKIKVPYALGLLFVIIGWAFLCGAFAYVVIITIARFETGSAREVFIIAAPLIILLVCFISTLRYGGFGFLGGKDIKIINKNISERGIIPGLTMFELRETFEALVSICHNTVKNVMGSSFFIIFFLVLLELINKASIYDLLIIIVTGFVATFFSAAFAEFFCQQAMSPIVKDFRRILFERGEKIENIQLSGIGSKFYFLFVLPIFTGLIILIMSFPVKLNVIIIFLIGLTMTFIIDRVLFVYLSDSLREMEGFAKELPKGERAVFTTGSLDKEIVELANNLNSASEEINSSQKKLVKSQEEMAKRVAELEKFFELTINREVKMIELKKEINKLKGNVQEDDA